MGVLKHPQHPSENAHVRSSQVYTMGKAFMIRVMLFFPLLLALWGRFDIAIATCGVKKSCLEMIGSVAESFNPEQHKSSPIKRFEVGALPELGASCVNGLTVTFKIKVQQYVSGWNIIFRVGEDPFRTPATWFHGGSTRVHPRVSTSTNLNDGGDSRGNVFNLNQWHHAAYVLNDVELLFYVDGKVVMIQALKGKVLYSNGRPFFIGQEGHWKSFHGQLKFFRFYNFALTMKQVKEDESSSKPISARTPRPEGLEMIGSVAESFSPGRRHHGSQLKRFEPGALPELAASPHNGLTVTFKIKVQEYVNGWTVIFHGGIDPFRTPATWFHHRSTRVHPRVSTSTNLNDGGDSRGNVFNLNQWHHAAYVLNDVELLFYVDGEVVMTHAIKGKVLYSNARPFYIGHDTKFNSFNGQLKYFRFYNFALSKKQVKEDQSSLKPITDA